MLIEMMTLFHDSDDDGDDADAYSDEYDDNDLYSAVNCM